MIDPKIEKEFNLQIRYEFESAYLYYQMAAYFHQENLPGMAHWMTVQRDEERLHAQMFFDNIVLRGGYPRLSEFSQPADGWKSPLEVFEAAYKHEIWVTSRIHGLAKLAQENGDYAAFNFLQWFVREQVEEEDNTLKISQRLKRIGGDVQALYMLDNELAARPAAPVTPPAAGAGAADGPAA